MFIKKIACISVISCGLMAGVAVAGTQVNTQKKFYVEYVCSVDSSNYDCNGQKILAHSEGQALENINTNDFVSGADMNPSRCGNVKIKASYHMSQPDEGQLELFKADGNPLSLSTLQQCKWTTRSSSQTYYPFADASGPSINCKEHFACNQLDRAGKCMSFIPNGTSCA